MHNYQNVLEQIHYKLQGYLHESAVANYIPASFQNILKVFTFIQALNLYSRKMCKRINLSIF